MILATNIAFVLISIGALAALVRLVRGPSLADRVVATDLLLTFLVIGSALLSAREGRGVYLEVMLVVAVVGFLGTAMVARFIERRGA
jgi:multisubunit Na+/H+ antiporter MnhF subunit